jgi:hypothetical protein
LFVHKIKRYLMFPDHQNSKKIRNRDLHVKLKDMFCTFMNEVDYGAFKSIKILLEYKLMARDVFNPIFRQ